MPMLLDEIMPAYHFRVGRSTVVHAAPGRVFRVIRDMKPADIPLFAALFWMRELPGRLAGRGIRYFPSHETLLEGFKRLGFLVLAEAPGQEIVVGAIAQWWRPRGAEFARVADLSEFLTFQRPGYAKAAANFHLAVDDDPRRTRVRHETRIYAADPGTRRRFAAYWWMIYPGVTLIRTMWLRSIKARAEER